MANERIDDRLDSHIRFVRDRFETHGRFGYTNRHYSFPVVTRQETELLLNRLVKVKAEPNCVFHSEHALDPQPEFNEDWGWFFSSSPDKDVKRPRKRLRDTQAHQLDVFQAEEEP